ncbi:isocitrate/isopropylmalate family dehydrogenase [Paraglaciecola aquimarina]|uniref:3-isopropylmalate dehydrogenase n=1 Tax=Paraglaciecola algarum TaxID=3050085 RepID=A0ABS9DCQ4_9ALTE|nr:isocitrate/isopropylmalate family dehydrogenase [Paraglaciecola sp. G1-23]MCF2950132.1 isocitrate/isopropylmalate family dehydrogenase [Paraglaciecola sp. G1-23]
MTKTNFTITVLPGDGIGHEITEICLDLLNQVVSKVGGNQLEFTSFAAGAAHYKETGISLPEEAMQHAFNSDATLLACMGLPSIRYPDGREIAPQLELREKMDLFAGVRPVKTMPGLPLPLTSDAAKNLDFVLIRESTEGLFASRETFKIEGEGESAAAYDTQKISYQGCKRVFDFAFGLAKQRKQQGYQGKVTCVDKANVLGSFYFMRQVFDERAKNHTDITAEHIYVDAAALQLVAKPWQFDVLVTENMFGDILSDLGAGLMGGMGMAPSADIGFEKAVFQPCHGTAPDIIGQGKANPTAMFLSGAMMLDWLGHQHNNVQLIKAANLVNKAVENAYASEELLPYELGGNSGTKAITDKVFAELAKL